MFGSKDKPEHPQQGAGHDGDGKTPKKGLFGWMRRKADEPAVAPTVIEPETPSAVAPAQPEPQIEVPDDSTQVNESAAQDSHDQAARQAAAELFSSLGQATEKSSDAGGTSSRAKRLFRAYAGRIG